MYIAAIMKLDPVECCVENITPVQCHLWTSWYLKYVVCISVFCSNQHFAGKQETRMEREREIGRWQRMADAILVLCHTLLPARHTE